MLGRLNLTNERILKRIIRAGGQEEGRTWEEALKNGTLFTAEWINSEGKTLDGTYPGCKTPRCAAAALSLDYKIPQKQEISVYRHLQGSRPGATVIEEYKTIVIFSSGKTIVNSGLKY